MSGFGDIAVVLLAAGLSRRFGAADKLEYPFRGKPLALHAAETLAGLPFGQKLAVCAAEHDRVPEHLAALGFAIVVNPAPENGQGTSLALGAAAVGSVAAVLVCLADMPNISSELLMRLVEGWNSDPVRPAAATAGDYLGPPALFPRTMLPDLMALDGDRGAKRLLAEATPIAAAPKELRDFDLPTDFQ